MLGLHRSRPRRTYRPGARALSNSLITAFRPNVSDRGRRFVGRGLGETHRQGEAEAALFERVAECGSPALCPLGASPVSSIPPILARRLLASVRMTTQILKTTTARTRSVRGGWQPLAAAGTIKSKHDALPLRTRSWHIPASQQRRTKRRWYAGGRLQTARSARSGAWRSPTRFHATLRI